MPFTMEMPSGVTVEGIPDDTTDEQIRQWASETGRLEEFGLDKPTTTADVPEAEPELGRFTGRAMKREELGLLDKTGDFLADIGKALQVHGQSFVQSGTRALLTPRKVLNTAGTGFVDVTSEEGQKVREIERTAYRDAIHAPEEDSAAGITGQVASIIIDPVGLSASVAGGGPANLARMMKVFGATAGYAGSLEALDQAAKEGRIEDPLEVLKMAGVGS
jgi:hypothetical protein